MKKTPVVAVYPREGVYPCTLHVRLSCLDPKARIFYTLDGREPTVDSAEFIYENGLILLSAVPGEEKTYTIRAVACAEGCAPSAVTTYRYTVACKREGEYYVEMLRERTEDTAGVFRIMDYDTDKMYLIAGTTRALLIDGGLEGKGDLPGLCEALVGDDLPVSLFIAHGHLDHYGQAGNFMRSGRTVYMAHGDIACIRKLHMPIPYDDMEAFEDVRDGDTYDLGNAVLRAYAVPGHTPASMVLVDERTGDVFASDAFGSARRYVPDSLFMQLGDEECALDAYLAALTSFRERTRGKIRTIYTGHSDEPLPAEAFLDFLIDTVSRALKEGESALIPTVRSREECLGSGTVVSGGDYRTDPLWTLINVKYIRAEDARRDPPGYARGYVLPDFGKRFGE